MIGSTANIDATNNTPDELDNSNNEENNNGKDEDTNNAMDTATALSPEMIASHVSFTRDTPTINGAVYWPWPLWSLGGSPQLFSRLSIDYK